jgi:hypothetical protein
MVEVMPLFGYPLLSFELYFLAASRARKTFLAIGQPIIFFLKKQDQHV